MSESSIPTAMQWRFKTIRKLLKETVPMTPNNGQDTVKPGQRIIVDLPFNSTVDLSTFTWFYKVKQIMPAPLLMVCKDMFVLVSFLVILLLLFNQCK